MPFPSLSFIKIQFFVIKHTKINSLVKTHFSPGYNDTAHFLKKNNSRSYYFNRAKERWVGRNVTTSLLNLVSLLDYPHRLPLASQEAKQENESQYTDIDRSNSPGSVDAGLQKHQSDVAGNDQSKG